MSREVAFSRAHLVNSSCNKLTQAHKGIGARQGRIGVVWGGWGGRPVGEEELLSPQLEARV